MLPSRILDAQKQAIISEESLVSSLLEARVVYVGEKHNSPHDHAVQMRILHLLREQDPSIGIGLEMVKRPFQPALDRFLSGETDEDTFLAEVEWDERWGFPFFLYRPVLRYAKAYGIPVYALNARDEITRKVAREGIDALDEMERAAIPDLDLTNEAHRQAVMEAFGGHHHGVMEEHGPHGALSFDNFYAAQVIWDETMAYEVARILREEGAPERLVVLAGAGHVRDGHGIPARAAKRGAKPYRTVLPLLLREEGPTLDQVKAEPGSDFVWLMGGG